MTATEIRLPQYDAAASWRDLLGRALTHGQAKRIRGTAAVTEEFSNSQRHMLARVCADLGTAHFLVLAPINGTMEVWRTLGQKGGEG